MLSPDRDHQLLQAWTYHGKVTVKQLDNQVKTINDFDKSFIVLA